MVSGSVDSGCHKLSENVWFVWSKTSYSGDPDGRTTTSENRATQLFICEKLSLAIQITGVGAPSLHLWGVFIASCSHSLHGDHPPGSLFVLSPKGALFLVRFPN